MSLGTLGDDGSGIKLGMDVGGTTAGLVVDEETGEVKKEDGSFFKGLYTSGHCAVGITSTGYVSGLSIADTVFSGRHAGRHTALKGE